MYKSIKYIILCFTVTLSVMIPLRSKDNNMSINEKIDFIIMLMESPDDYSKIIQDSEYFSDSIFGSNKMTFKRFELYYLEQLRDFKNKSIIKINADTNTHCISLIYIGDNKELNPYLSFYFTKINGRWILLEPTSNGRNFIFSNESLEYFNHFEAKNIDGFKHFRSASIIKNTKNIILNYDSSFDKKLFLINRIVNRSYKYDDFRNFNKSSDSLLLNNFNLVNQYDSLYEKCKLYPNIKPQN